MKGCSGVGVLCISSAESDGAGQVCHLSEAQSREAQTEHNCTVLYCTVLYCNCNVLYCIV